MSRDELLQELENAESVDDMARVRKLLEKERIFLNREAANELEYAFRKKALHMREEQQQAVRELADKLIRPRDGAENVSKANEVVCMLMYVLQAYDLSVAEAKEYLGIAKGALTKQTLVIGRMI